MTAPFAIHFSAPDLMPGCVDSQVNLRLPAGAGLVSDYLPELFPQARQGYRS